MVDKKIKCKFGLLFLMAIVCVIFCANGVSLIRTKPNLVLANENAVTESGNVNITVLYQNADGLFETGLVGGGCGLVIDSCNNSTLEIDTSLQNYFFVKVKDNYTFDGVYTAYADGKFSGTKLQQNYISEDGAYQIECSSENFSQYFVKISLKKVTVTFDNIDDLFKMTGDGTYTVNSKVRISCESNSSKYVFYKWVKIVNGMEVDFATQSSYEFTVDSNITLRAKNKMLFQILNTENGNIELYVSGVKSNDNYFVKGTTIEVRAISNKGYSFVSWQGAEFLDRESVFSFTFNSPSSIGVIFESKKTTVTISSGDEDYCDISSSTVVEDRQFKIGDIIYIEAIVNQNYALSKWDTNANGDFDTNFLKQSYTITADDVENGNLYFTANIVKEYATVQFEVNGKGIIFINNDSTRGTLKLNLKIGQTYKLIFASSTNHYLSGVKFYDSLENMTEKLDNVVDDELLITISQDCKITAVYAAYTWYDVKTPPQGYGLKNNPYLITTEQELAFMAYAINYDLPATVSGGVDYKSAYYKLETNLDLTGRYWILIGANSDAKFTGVLDLNFKNIKNINLFDDTIFSGYRAIFTNENQKTLKVTRDLNKLWTTVGIISSAVFALSIVLVIFALTQDGKKKVKKVIIMDKDIFKK